jgi:CRISPR system Cascade subunit CasA
MGAFPDFSLRKTKTAQAGCQEKMLNLSLISEPLISARNGAGQRRAVTLPDLLAHLGRGAELEPLALRPHQHHAFHAFLVQLGALVAHRTGNRSLDRPPEAWRQALLDLAGDAGEAAWSLVVSDLALPAFLQPPVPEGSLAGFRNEVTEPDGLDVVITAKNHDVKAGRMTAPGPEHWLYALLTLQTMEGFLGRGNYGIARMNGGFASRPAVATAPGQRWAERFRRDVGVWLDARQELINGYGYLPVGGHALLWLLPWDGTTSRSLQECDPFFLEVCRRVRLIERSGRTVAVTRPTERALLDAKELRGDTGDVWTPVKASAQGPTALTVGHDGFSYRLMSQLLFPDQFPRRPALVIRDEDGKQPVVVAQVLVRGKGKTDGYHQRMIPVPEKVRRRLLSMAGIDELRGIARERIDKVATAQRSVLQPALCALLQGGPESLDFTDARARPWLDRFDAEIDQVFFADLWDTVDAPREEHESAWNRRLFTLAWKQLEHAIASAPVPLAQRPRAVARAELLFRGTARKHLPTLDPSKEAPMEEET